MTIKEIYDITGSDYNDVLKRVPTEGLLKKFLTMYISSDEHENLVEAYESKDYRRLFEVTHNLKGMSGNLSLTKVYENIQTICEAVRHGDPEIDLEPLVEQAKEDYAKLKGLVEGL